MSVAFNQSFHATATACRPEQANDNERNLHVTSHKRQSNSRRKSHIAPSTEPVRPIPLRLSLTVVALAFGVLASIAFGPSLNAPFDFDDGPAIVHNLSIRVLWPPSIPLSPPGLGTAVSGRPAVNYSFALNSAINRWFDGIAANRPTAGFHIVNIALHVLVALLLFSIIRRTLFDNALANVCGLSAEWVALISTGLWLVHPIQTEAVDYVSQRTELMVSACYLATIASSQRVFHGLATGQKSWIVVLWMMIAVAMCAVGMASKEVMVTAPLMVMLFDRTFYARSWHDVFSRPFRRGLYAGLVSTTLIAVGLVLSGGRAATVGFHLAISSREYLCSQGWAVGRYLSLIALPDRLTYDYGSQPICGWTVVPGVMSILALMSLTILALTRKEWHWAGFLGTLFFALLAPSSSVVPIQTEIAAERRVYLALAPLTVLGTIGIAAAFQKTRGTRWNDSARLALVGIVSGVFFLSSGWTARVIAPDGQSEQILIRVIVGLIAGCAVWMLLAKQKSTRRVVLAMVGLLMIAASSRRSALYRDPSLLWRDAASKAPNNARAVDGVGTVEMRLGPSHFATADSLLSRAIELDSTFVTARVRRAAIAVSESRLVDAETLLVHALRISPGDSAATDQLGLALLADGRPDSASVYLSTVARVFPSATTLAHAGMAHFEAGNLDSAVVLLQRAVRLDSARTDALFYLGAALVESARGGEAIPFLERESAIDPTRPLSLGVLAVAYAQGAQPDRARRAVEAAVERAPTNEALFVFAGRAMQTLHDFQAASRFFTHAVELSPNDPQAWTRLGVAEASLGNTSRAQVFLRRALSIEPRYGPVQAAIMSGVR